jgi:hypothetical protein
MKNPACILKEEVYPIVGSGMEVLNELESSLIPLDSYPFEVLHL